MTEGKKEGKITSDDFERLFPFLILLLIGLVRFITSKKKKEEQREPARQAPKVPSVPTVKKSLPPQTPIAPPLTVEKPAEKAYTHLEIKRDQHFWRKKKKTKVQRLVANAGGKQKMILLTEILKKHDFLQF